MTGNSNVADARGLMLNGVTMPRVHHLATGDVSCQLNPRRNNTLVCCLLTCFGENYWTARILITSWQVCHVARGVNWGIISRFSCY